MATKYPTRSPSEKSFILVFTVGQFLGVFPLEFSADIQFKWGSYKTIYTIFHLFLEGFVVMMCVVYGCSNGWTFRNLLRMTFYSSNFWGTIGLFRLARKLPTIIKKWKQVDMDMEKNYGYPQNLYRRTKVTSTAALIYASGQIFIFIWYNFFRTKDIIAKKIDVEFGVSSYFKTAFPQVFAFVPYSAFIGVLCQLNYIFTYLRMVYIELFLSLISSFLSLRFRQITKRLSAALDKKNTIEFWKQVREDYDKICYLCRTTDDKIAEILLASFTGNLLLLLAYLRSCTIVEELNSQKAYNLCAFIILIVRAIVLLLYVSWVNDESKEPAFVLNSVSSAQYNSEIQRFLLQLSFDDVAFTGCKMFKVTRTLILNIGGVILTYELVLVQFVELNIFG